MTYIKGHSIQTPANRSPPHSDHVRNARDCSFEVQNGSFTQMFEWRTKNSLSQFFPGVTQNSLTMSFPCSEKSPGIPCLWPSSIYQKISN